MSGPWKKISEPVGVRNLSDIMSEEVAKSLQVKDDKPVMKFAESVSDQHVLPADKNISVDLPKEGEDSNVIRHCDSDAIIAKVLQSQFDKGDDEIKAKEKKRNGDTKISISFDDYCHNPSNLVYDLDSEDDDVYMKPWDGFDSHEKEFACVPKKGYKSGGVKVTKHVSHINGRRNASRVMAFSQDFRREIDTILPKSVINSLKVHSRRVLDHRLKMLDREESQATAFLGIDEYTKVVLFKLINNGMLGKINGVISAGEESVLLHADSNPSFPDVILPKECVIKVFNFEVLNDYERVRKYIEADYHLKDCFSKQNPRKIVHMWAGKEMHNMMRLQKIGINCPDMICLKNHVLVMSFIGRDKKPAPKIKDIILKDNEWASVYEEVVDIMHKMFNVGHMIHADLSEYNILWHDNKCWIIDVPQSVEPDHPHGLQLLLRDCRSINNFFNRKGVPSVKSAEGLFKYITGFEDMNVSLLDDIHPISNSLTTKYEIALDDSRVASYPFLKRVYVHQT